MNPKYSSNSNRDEKILVSNGNDAGINLSHTFPDDETYVDSEECARGRTVLKSNGNDSNVIGRKHCSFMKGLVASFIVLFIVSGLVVYFIGGNDALPQSLQGIIPDPEHLFRSEDPLNGEVYGWPPTAASNAGGLELTLLNCLDEDWHPFFNLAVQQWDNGSPDTLTLDTQVLSPEPTCSRVRGTMKVCNGDYGQTDWKGVNEILLQNNYIVSSTAKMNEYFLSGASDAERQYTMCHEIGHGFGLPHTDERFWNRDQGNCMDYTSRPQRNMQPDSVNFETLASVYGEVGGTRPPYVQDEPTVQPMPANKPRTPFQEESEETNTRDNDDRLLRASAITESLKPQNEFPSLVMQRLQDIDGMVFNRFRMGKKWRMLHQSTHTRRMEMDLGEGFKVQLHFLLANNDD